MRLGEENKNRYVIATQSLELRKELRKVAGTPIIYIARSVVLLETPSDQTLAKKSSVRFVIFFSKPRSGADFEGTTKCTDGKLEITCTSS